MLKQIRNYFWAGLISLAVGAGLLALAFFLGQMAEGAARTLHNVLSLVALLLAVGGGFLTICTGAVLLVSAMTAPRVPRSQKS
jgi:putative intracellular protease/amidase